jgi:RNA polymerase-binding transcription factor DksA
MSKTRTPAAFVAPTPVQLATFRDQLEEQHRFRLDQLEELRTIDPDNSSEVTEVLAAGARAALHDVLAALYRMDAGTYGVCTDCGAHLPIERLEVLPQVGQCLPCRRDAAIRTGR